MARYNSPTEEGAGGERGYFDVKHWTKTEKIEKSTKVRRQKEDSRYSREKMMICLTTR
jgi:hypothetical protein